MAINTSTLTDYTWAQIKLGCKHSMLAGALGGVNLAIEGRTIGRYSADEVMALYKFADEMETIETNAEQGGGIAQVVFADPS
jgi:hypothetical protein